MARTGGLVRRALEPIARYMTEIAGREVMPTPGAVMFAAPAFMAESMALMRVNRERFRVYEDVWRMYEDSPLVGASVNQYLADATAEQFTVRCDDKEALRIINECLERTEYQRKREAFLFRMFWTGDAFVQRLLGNAYGTQRTKVWTECLDVLPEHTMFRNSNKFDRFADVRTAFYQQIPFSPFHLDITAPKQYLPQWQTIHARWNVWRQPHPKYGVAYSKAGRIDYNRLNRTVQMMSVARQSTAYRRLIWKLGSPEAPHGAEAVREFVKENLDGKEESPLTEYAVPGNVDVKMIDPKNEQLSNIKDAELLLNLFEMALPYSPKLLGLWIGGSGLSEGELNVLEEVLKRSISYLYTQEEYEILRPLLEFELALHNKFVKFDVVYKPYALEDQNKKSKRIMSEVQMNTMSRETAWELTHREISTWEDEKARILDEQEEGLSIGAGAYAGGKYQAPPESLDKGKKGVQKDPAAQDVADEYATGG